MILTIIITEQQQKYSLKHGVYAAERHLGKRQSVIQTWSFQICQC